MTGRLIYLFAFLMLLIPAAHPATETPESAARAYFESLQEHGLGSIAGYLHPDELARFKDTLLPLFQAEAAAGKSELLTLAYGKNATISDVESSAPIEFMIRFMMAASSRFASVPVSFETIEVLGTVKEGDVVHVLVRTRVKAGTLTTVSMEVLSMKRFEDRWKMMLTVQIEGMVQALRQSR